MVGMVQQLLWTIDGELHHGLFAGTSLLVHFTLDGTQKRTFMHLGNYGIVRLLIKLTGQV